MCLSYKLKWLWRTKFFLFIFVDRTKDNNQEKWAWNENWENCTTSSLPSNRCVVVINKKLFSLWNIHVLLAVLAWLCRPRKLVKGQESESHEIIGGNLAKEISFCFVIYFFSQIHVTLIQFAHSSADGTATVAAAWSWFSVRLWVNDAGRGRVKQQQFSKWKVFYNIIFLHRDFIFFFCDAEMMSTNSFWFIKFPLFLCSMYKQNYQLVFCVLFWLTVTTAFLCNIVIIFHQF